MIASTRRPGMHATGKVERPKTAAGRGGQRSRPDQAPTTSMADYEDEDDSGGGGGGIGNRRKVINGDDARDSTTADTAGGIGNSGEEEGPSAVSNHHNSHRRHESEANPNADGRYQRPKSAWTSGRRKPTFTSNFDNDDVRNCDDDDDEEDDLDRVIAEFHRDRADDVSSAYEPNLVSEFRPYPVTKLSPAARVIEEEVQLINWETAMSPVQPRSDGSRRNSIISRIEPPSGRANELSVRDSDFQSGSHYALPDTSSTPRRVDPEFGDKTKRSMKPSHSFASTSDLNYIREKVREKYNNVADQPTSRSENRRRSDAMHQMSSPTAIPEPNVPSPNSIYMRAKLKPLARTTSTDYSVKDDEDSFVVAAKPNRSNRLETIVAGTVVQENDVDACALRDARRNSMPSARNGDANRLTRTNNSRSNCENYKSDLPGANMPGAKQPVFKTLSNNSETSSGLSNVDESNLALRKQDQLRKINDAESSRNQRLTGVNEVARFDAENENREKNVSRQNSKKRSPRGKKSGEESLGSSSSSIGLEDYRKLNGAVGSQRNKFVEVDDFEARTQKSRDKFNHPPTNGNTSHPKIASRASGETDQFDNFDIPLSKRSNLQSNLPENLPDDFLNLPDFSMYDSYARTNYGKPSPFAMHTENNRLNGNDHSGGSRREKAVKSKNLNNFNDFESFSVEESLGFSNHPIWDKKSLADMWQDTKKGMNGPIKESF